MNRMGSPVGILLIGAGLVVLYLGWSGKWADLVAAIFPGADDIPFPGPGNLDNTPDKGANCNSTADCGNNETCQNGKCVKAPSNPPCQKNSDCPTGTTCNNGTCRDEFGCGPGTRHVKMDATGHEECILNSELASPEGGKCRTGYNMGILIEKGSRTQICVKSVRGAGAAENTGFGNYSIVQLPTGFFGTRYQPNV